VWWLPIEVEKMHMHRLRLEQASFGEVPCAKEERTNLLLMCVLLLVNLISPPLLLTNG